MRLKMETVVDDLKEQWSIQRNRLKNALEELTLQNRKLLESNRVLKRYRMVKIVML